MRCLPEGWRYWVWGRQLGGDGLWDQELWAWRKERWNQRASFSLSIHWKTFRLFVFPRYCKHSCNEHYWAIICGERNVKSFGYMPRLDIVGFYDRFIFSLGFFTQIWEWLVQVVIPPRINESFLSPCPQPQRNFSEPTSQQLEWNNWILNSLDVPISTLQHWGYRPVLLPYTSFKRMLKVWIHVLLLSHQS